MTKDDKYKPTPAENRLLNVVLDTDNVGKNVTELCNLAGISRNKYYEAMHNEQFKELITETSVDLIKGRLGDVINATIKYSLEEKGHQDRKMLLTMAGLYKDKQDINTTGDIGIEVKWS